MFRSILSQPRLDPTGLADLEARWRGFAVRAGASFFQDWTWVGCQAAQRFPDPVLLEVCEGDQLVGLALFNRRVSRWRGDSLYLHESDDPVLNSIFTEHNGPLLAAEAGARRDRLLAAVLQEAMQGPLDGGGRRPRRLVLSGVGSDCGLAAARIGAHVTEASSRIAPYVDFALLAPELPFIDQLRRNTRHQLRRSNRLYETFGPLTLHRADTVETALDYLNKLVLLHDITWNARGKPGAFATQAVRRFHRALIRRGVPTGEIDLLRVTAGQVMVGYLMNFNHGGQVSAYQSGFNYSVVGQQLKPGLTCHFLALEAYRTAGVTVYDFLAGPDRYKLSLANAQRSLHWLSVAPPGHPSALILRLRARVGALLPKRRAT